MDLDIKTKTTWKKVLYEKQDLPDNYTDTSFLYDLKKNAHVRRLGLHDTITGAGLLSRAISVVVVVGEVFVALQYALVDPLVILGCFTLLNLIGYIIYIIIYQHRSVLKDLGLAVLYVIFTSIMCPVLRTLTETISTDTIYVTSVLMMIVHLIFYDYDFSSATVYKALSFNSALFSTLCLSSRLNQSLDVFVLLTVAVSCFALLPPLLANLEYSNGIAAVFDLVALAGLWFISFTEFVIFLIVLVALNLAIPYMIFRWQKYKDNITGPWDEAKPVVEQPVPNSKSKLQ